MPALLSARAAGCLVAASLTAMAASPALAYATTSTGTETAYAGHAFGATVALGTNVTQSPLANVALCTKDGTLAPASPSTAAFTLAGLIGTIGPTTTSVASKPLSGGKVESVSTTTVGQTSLASGLIQFTSLKVTATVTRTGTTYQNTGGLTFTGLQIVGLPALSQTPAANKSAIQLDGLGSLVMYQRKSAVVGGSHTELVTGLQLTVDPSNLLGLPGGNLVVGYADASLHEPVHHMASGSSYATSVGVGDALTSAKTATNSIPCGGSGGVTKKVPLPSVNIPNVLNTGTTTSTESSQDTAATTSAVTSSVTSNISLFNGVVTATTVTAKAKATRSGSKVTSSIAGSGVVGLVIKGGAPVTITGPATKSVPGYGTLYIDRKPTGSGVKVYALQLVLASPHAGLKANTTITIGYAQATVSA